MPSDISIPILFRTYTESNELAARKPDGLEKLGELEVGETVQLRVKDRHWVPLESWLKEYSVDDVDSVEIQLRKVVFDDGTIWMFGQDSVTKRGATHNSF